jgi:peptidoglycan/LPS O-acetylase OafA/YrhL
MQDGGSRIPGFDGLRALAMLAVFAGHANIQAAHNAGFLGVVGFMALSGYLITWLLHRYRLRAETTDASARTLLGRFLKRRALRILPAYYLLLAAIGVASFFVHIAHARAMPAYLLFLTNLWVGLQLQDWPGPFSHLWSLSVQEQFYLLWGPLLLFTPAARHAAICVGVLAAGLSGTALLLALRAPDITVYTSPILNFGVLAAGGLFAVKGRDLLKAPPVRWGAGVAAAAAAGFALAPLAHLTVSLWLLYPAATLAACGLVAGLHHGALPPLATALQAPVLAWLGVRSYGFYLYHLFVNSWLYPVLRRFTPPVADAIGRLPHPVAEAALALAGFAVTLLLAQLSWRWIERPMLALGDDRRRAPAAPETVRPRRAA